MRSLSKRIGNVIDCGSFNDINLNSQHEVDLKKDKVVLEPSMMAMHLDYQMPFHSH